ncbi:hypothetical protein [Rhodopirellula bahusiensis]|uniref:hypothetical protein n=1 Tax=Rhodopirellula bahusiensis TaxID=2014065 RepID=UPI003266A261
MRRFLAIIPMVVVFASLWAWNLKADPPVSQEESNDSKMLTPLMHLKLEKSKSILEGLSLEDFDKIASNAQSLKLLSTEAGWNVIQTREYADQSRDFQRAADLIVDAANDEDIHRAAMGYVAMTLRCVECHSYMRNHREGLIKLSTDTPE